MSTSSRAVTRELRERPMLIPRLGMAIGDLYTDLRDGILLINLLEAISEKKVGPYNRNPRIGAQRLENQGIALNFIKVGSFCCAYLWC